MRLWVDEGHGGADSGAVGGGNVEDRKNLLLGEAVEYVARWQGWKVDSTREKDIFVTLSKRVAEANHFDADVFVSIHHDWKGGKQAVVYPNNHDAARSKRLADKINYRIEPVAPTDSIIYADRRGLAVLKGTDMPAVIIEAARIQDDYSRRRMARAIVRGICDYKGVTYKAPMPTLKRGDDGIAVITLKKALAKRGYKGMDMKSDLLGGGTEKALIAFKRSKGLQATGVCGPKTWHALGY